MNYPPAYRLHDFCIDPSLRITSTAAAAWALTTLCSVMHCNLQTSLRRGRKKAVTCLIPIKLLSTLSAPYSSCSPALSSLLPWSPLLHSTPSWTCLLLLPHLIKSVTIQPMLQIPKTGAWQYLSYKSSGGFTNNLSRSLFFRTCV